MKFDYIIGNPPYNNNSKTVYHLFIEKFLTLKYNQMVMIIPNNWMTGGKGLTSFRTRMQNTKNIKKIVEYPNDFEIFKDVWIRGGVQYIVFNKQKNTKTIQHIRIKNGEIIQNTERLLNKYSIIIRDKKAEDMLDKIPKQKIQIPNIKFNIASDYKDYKEHPFKSSVKLYGQRQKMIPINGGKKGIGYIQNKNFKYLNKYKVITRKATSNNSKRGVNPVFIIEKNAVVSDTYLVLGVFDTIKEASDFCLYQSTKFVRYLVEITKTNVSVSVKSFKFVPKYEGLKTDEEIIKKYGLQDYKNLLYSIIDRKVNHIDREQYPKEINQWVQKVEWVD
jgi:site-specific DNA-methyltransferase (adenine-specific)